MEILPDTDDRGWGAITLVASSIADLTSSPERAVEQIQQRLVDRASRMPRILRPGRAFNRLTAAVFRAATGNQHFYETVGMGALIFLPLVRHDPEDREGLGAQKLRLADQTGKLDVGFSNRVLSKVYRDGDGELDLQSLARQDWTSDVMLDASYLAIPRGISTLYGLLDVSNRYAAQKQPKDITSWVQSLNLGRY